MNEKTTGYIDKLGYGVLVLSALFSIFKYFTSWEFDVRDFKIAIIYMIALILIVAVLSILFSIKKFKLEKQFLIIALIFGLGFVFTVPPLQMADENVHVYRSYDLAKGRILYKRHNSSMMLPSSLREFEEKILFKELKLSRGNEITIDQYKEAINIPIDKSNVEEYDSSATGAYTTVAYVPQAIGMFIGDLFNLPPYFLIILGRLFNLLAWIFLGYNAIKFMPIKRHLLMIVMLMPMSINQAANLSPDALLNSSSFLAFSYILYLKFKKEKVEVKDICVLLGLGLVIAGIKLPYMLILGLIILIPKEKFRWGYLLKYSTIIVLLVTTLLGTSLWKNASSPVSTSINTSLGEGSQVVIEESKETQTIKSIVNQPMDFVENIGNTFKERVGFYMKSFAAFFGWLDTEVPVWFLNTLWGMLFLSVFLSREREQTINIFDSGVLLLYGIGMYSVLCAVCLQWGGYNLSNKVVFEGIQGRYFFPFIVPFLIGFYKLNIKIKCKKLIMHFNKYFSLYLCWTLAFSLGVIFIRFFMDNY